MYNGVYRCCLPFAIINSRAAAADLSHAKYAPSSQQLLSAVVANARTTITAADVYAAVQSL